MLRKLKQLYLDFRINSARADMRLSLLAMRDNARLVHVHADNLEALLKQSGHSKAYHFSMVELSLAKSQAGYHIDYDIVGEKEEQRG